MSETKVTTANVRIMISHNYSCFEVAMNLENPEGINNSDIDEARVQCQALTNKAVKEYQDNRQDEAKANSAVQKKGLLKSMGELQKDSGSKIGVKDNAPLDEILSKPLYVKPEKSVKKTPAKKAK